MFWKILIPNLFLVGMLILLSRCSVALEEPGYEVIGDTEHYQIRRYRPYLVAEVDVEGSFASSGREAFPVLAGYIFGNNRESEKMRMTAPVEARPSDEGTQMAMTAPVTSIRKGDDRYTYGFVMERKYSRETLPQPVDPRVRIREVPARTVAARAFSGRWTAENFLKQEKRLRSALVEDGIAAMGPLITARYNGPFTPWFLRRNEVIVEIDHDATEEGD